MIKKVTPPRPTSEDPQIVDQAMRSIAEKVILWGLPDYWTEDVQMVIGALKYTHYKDAYKWAKQLDKHAGLDPDTALVMILDKYPEQLRQATFAAEAQWVRDYNLIGLTIGSTANHPQFGLVRVAGNIHTGYSAIVIDHRSNAVERDKMLAGTGGPYREVAWEDLTLIENAHQITET